MEIREHSIGYNTITSANGIISTRGVKSKPNDLQVFGYTHEIGEGEKSPDNTYTLVSLDSGNVNLCNNWNYTSDLFTIIGNRITVQKASNTIRYVISDFKKFTYDKTKLYIYFKYSGSFTAGANIPICSIRLYNAERKELYYLKISDKFPSATFNKCIGINLSSIIDINSIAYYSLTVEGLTYDGSADYDFTVDVLMCENYIYSYFEDEHSIVLFNNDKSMQVPTLIALNSVKGISDRIVKKEDGYYVEQNTKKFIIDDSIKNDYFVLQKQQNGIVQFATRVPDRDGRIVNENKILCDKLISLYMNMDFYEHIRNSDRKYPNSVIIYLSIHRMTENSTVTEDEILAYLKDNPLTLLYQVENPYYLKLSDYAQELLNSFELQNNNNIFIDGYPDLKISGYLQKI